MFARAKRTSASSQSPWRMKNMRPVETAPSRRNAPRKRSLAPAKSARAPSIGASRAMIASPIVVAMLKRAVAVERGSPDAATAEKKIGKMAVTTTTIIAELAQSYMAHARSSGRSRPRRARRLEGIGGMLPRPGLRASGRGRLPEREADRGGERADDDGEREEDRNVDPRAQGHLEADEHQDERDAELEVDEPVHRTGQHEEEGAEAEDGEDVGAVDQERVAGDGEDRRDAVDREDEIGPLDDEQYQEERCGPDRAALEPRDELLSVIVLGEG